MKNTGKLQALLDKKITNHEKFRGGDDGSVDKPKKPTGLPKPPFGPKK